MSESEAADSDVSLPICELSENAVTEDEIDSNCELTGVFAQPSNNRMIDTDRQTNFFILIHPVQDRGPVCCVKYRIISPKCK